jgi:hypothetical protein
MGQHHNSDQGAGEPKKLELCEWLAKQRQAEQRRHDQVEVGQRHDQRHAHISERDAVEDGPNTSAESDAKSSQDCLCGGKAKGVGDRNKRQNCGEQTSSTDQQVELKGA